MEANNKKINSSSVGDLSDNEEYEVYCSLCKTAFAGTVPYRQHLKGSKHEKAQTKHYMKEKYGEKYLKAVSEMQSGQQDPNAESFSVKVEEDDDALVITCEVCKKVCTGHIPYQLHMASRKHAKQVQKQELMKKIQLENRTLADNGKKGDALFEIAPQLKPFASCNLCKKSFSGPEGYTQHLASEVHKKEVQRQDVIKDMKKTGVLFNEDKDGNNAEDSTFAFCTDCGKGFSGPIPYQQHLLSEVHKNKGKALELTEKMKHLMQTDEEGSFQCIECGKVFSGPQPLHQHLMGPDHSKQKKKKELLQNLEAKYPEFVKESAGNSLMNGEDSDSDGEYLVCTICHKCFSGPESAHDHFRSKKHIKAKKEKIRVEKLKQEKKVAKQKKGMGSKQSDSVETSTSDVAKAPQSTLKTSENAKSRQDSLNDEFEML